MKLTAYPLRLSLPAFILVFGLVTLTGLYFAELRGSYRLIAESAVTRTRTLGLITASDIESALRRADPASAQRSLERARADHDLQRAALISPDGRIIAATHFLDRGLDYGETDFAPVRDLIESGGAGGRAPVNIAQQGDQIVGVFVVKMAEPAEPGPADRPASLVTIHSLKLARMTARTDARGRLLAAALVLTLFSGLLWLIIRGLLLSRIQTLIDATSGISGGKFDTPIPIEGGDEIGSLAESLGRMALQLDQGARTLRDREEHFRSIIENMEDVVSIVDRDMVFEYVSPSTRRISGFSPDAFVGRSAFSGVAEDEVPRIRALLAAVLLGEVENAEFESGFVQADGSPAVYHTVCRALDAPGRPRRLLLVSRNVTELRRATTALKASEERFNSLFASLSDGAWAISANGTQFLYGNEALARIYGRTLAEFRTGRNVWLASVLPADMEIALQSARDVATTGSADHEYRIVRPDGEVRWIRDRKHLIRDETGRVVRMGGLVTDITDARRSQEERLHLEVQLRQTQKMEAIGTLAGGVAHDFNNLLTAINGYADLLQDAMGDGHELIGEVREIRQAGERAAALTRQLLLFSRQDVIQPRNLDLNHLVRNLGRMLTRLIGEHIQYETHLSDDLLEIWADAGQIEQVIVNLVVNARDAMEHGGRLEIRTERVRLSRADIAPDETLLPGLYGRLRVVDTGTGMSDVVLARIFEPFFTTKEVGKGTGLGLSTLYGIVKQCLGAIRVHTRPGEGSTFEVLLPLTGEGRDLHPSPEPPAPGTGGNETILFVEDERVVREVGARMLRQHGYRVIEASDGSEAIEAARLVEGRIDLLVSDLVMPHMTGRTLASRLLELYPDIRVLFVSGYTERAAGENLPLADQLPFLQKPYSPASLAAKVREVLGGLPARMSMNG